MCSESASMSCRGICATNFPFTVGHCWMHGSCWRGQGPSESMSVPLSRSKRWYLDSGCQSCCFSDIPGVNNAFRLKMCNRETLREKSWPIARFKWSDISFRCLYGREVKNLFTLNKLWQGSTVKKSLHSHTDFWPRLFAGRRIFNKNVVCLFFEFLVNTNLTENRIR